MFPENAGVVQMFLEALPSWRSGGHEHGWEGFDRAEIVALMDLHGVPQEDRKERWESIRLLESEFAHIRSIQRQQKNGRKS